MTEPVRRRLSSWKEISTYLARDVRTVARWERERGLPVHRVPGGKARSVFAYSDELDRWLASDPTRQAEADPSRDGVAGAGGRSIRGVLLLLAAAVVVALLVVLVGSAWVSPRPVVTLASRGGELVGLDREGQAIWRRALDTPLSPFTLDPRWTDLLDFDGDGSEEIVTGIQQLSSTRGQYTEDVYALTNNGRVLWRYRSNDTIAFRSGDYSPPWFMDAVAAYRVDGQPRIAVAKHHHTWWPGLLTVLDARGQPISRFVNSGWIQTLVASRDGRILIAAGVNNARDAQAAALFDGARVSGASPDEGSRYECVSCGAGRPLKYVVFPRSEVSDALRAEWRVPQVHLLPDGRIEVHLIQAEGDLRVAEAIYELSAGLEPLAGRVSDAYWDWHRRLEGGGALRHSADACEERLGLRVRVWDPATGWIVRRVR